MTTQQSVKTDERTVALVNASSRWALNFITFALLVDIMYRAAVLKEAAWDLFALLGVSGTISTVYLARHKVLDSMFGRNAIIAVVVAAVLAAIVAAIITMTRAS